MVLGLLFIPDPFVDVPPGFPRVVLLVMFLIATVFSGWVMFDTQRAMNWMASRGPEWWPGKATGIRLAKKPVWVWLYRIDCAVVFVGCVLMLITSLIRVLTR
jgi:hypothetical protein